MGLGVCEVVIKVERVIVDVDLIDKVDECFFRILGG